MLKRAGATASAVAPLPAALRAVKRSSRGVAALEMAVVTPVLLLLLANAYDLGVYGYRSLQVKSAAQMGAQAAWVKCDEGKLPATLYCPSLNAVVTAAIQSTTLGNKVTLSGTPSEAYYCVDSAGSLQQVSDVSNKPTNCSAVGQPAQTPGDYIQIQVTCPYVPMFSKLSVSKLLPANLTASARMRLK